MPECAKAIKLSGAQIVTVAVRRVNIFDKPVEEKINRDQDGYGKYQEPDDSDFDEPSKTKKLEGKSTYKQIMEM